MVATPVATPVTIPPVPTVATAVEPLVHTPPGVPLARVDILPTQIATGPDGEIEPGPVLTVTTAFAKQVALNEYLIVSVPIATPPTISVDPTVAIAVATLLHVPPGAASASVVLEPEHTVSVPVIGATPYVTVTTAVSQQPDGEIV